MNPIKSIAIIGLGYVGLPLAIEFGKKFKTIGYDTDLKRIQNLKNNIDTNKEISSTDIIKSKKLIFKNNIRDLKNIDMFIVTVQSPILKNKTPDLSYIRKATEEVSSVMKKKSFIVYESTVYPGATENYCLPILEKKSKLKLNRDFHLGYSPERTNPGDKKNKITDIIKVVSGSSDYALGVINEVYRSIIKAGTYKAKTIKVAEASKVIENIQRDLNIALMNELSIIFNKLELDTNDVLNCAKTKWNFNNYYPGLVGGHCIGVDPYYLTYISKQHGYKPNVILSGRNINNRMYVHIVNLFLKELKKKNPKLKKPKILIMGYTFKENVSDVRNTQVENMINFLKKKNFYNLDVYDPNVNLEDIKTPIKKIFIKKLVKFKYDGVIISVKHDKFIKFGPKYIKNLLRDDRGLIFDVKGILGKDKNIIKL
jgi:UDP-N-acetyl-D-glucosamine/UDP-N-acetyl-D-galactosamine dehydrogenase